MARVRLSAPPFAEARAKKLSHRTYSPPSTDVVSLRNSARYNMAMAGEPEAKAGFEKDLESLEEVVRLLEAGDMPLEESLKLFERAAALSESCRKVLEDAETRIEILTKRGGQFRPEPFRPDNG